MVFSFNKYDLCPCNSGKKAKFCCLEGNKWNKKPTLLRNQETNLNFSNDKCYANTTRNCTSKISREHIISQNILEDLELDKKVKIKGLPWQEKDTFNLFSKSSLVSNILCNYHNNLLSPFDYEMGRFFKTIRRIEESFINNNQENGLSVFCGEDLEKWMLKTFCGFIASNQILIDGEKKQHLINDFYVSILFDNLLFPSYCGMYFFHSDNEKIEYDHSLGFRVLVANHELVGAEFTFNNLKFYLLLQKPDYPKSFGIYRPRGIQFAKDKIIKRIEICWQDKTLNEGVFLTRIN